MTPEEHTRLKDAITIEDALDTAKAFITDYVRGDNIEWWDSIELACAIKELSDAEEALERIKEKI